MARASLSQAPKPPLVFIDSDVIMDWLHLRSDSHPDTGEPRHEIATAVIAAVLSGSLLLATSTLIEAEVCCNGETRSRDRDTKIKLGSLFDAPGTLRAEVDRFLTKKAIALAEIHSMRGADALHLAAAARMHCDFLMTHDGQYPIGQKIDGVQVIRPRVVWAETLLEVAQTA